MLNAGISGEECFLNFSVMFACSYLTKLNSYVLDTARYGSCSSVN